MTAHAPSGPCPAGGRSGGVSLRRQRTTQSCRQMAYLHDCLLVVLTWVGNSYCGHEAIRRGLATPFAADPDTAGHRVLLGLSRLRNTLLNQACLHEQRAVAVVHSCTCRGRQDRARAQKALLDRHHDSSTAPHRAPRFLHGALSSAQCPRGPEVVWSRQVKAALASARCAQVALTLHASILLLLQTSLASLARWPCGGWGDRRRERQAAAQFVGGPCRGDARSAASAQLAANRLCPAEARSPRPTACCGMWR